MQPTKMDPAPPLRAAVLPEGYPRGPGPVVEVDATSRIALCSCLAPRMKRGWVVLSSMPHRTERRCTMGGDDRLATRFSRRRRTFVDSPLFSFSHSPHCSVRIGSSSAHDLDVQNLCSTSSIVSMEQDPALHRPHTCGIVSKDRAAIPRFDEPSLFLPLWLPHLFRRPIATKDVVRVLLAKHEQEGPGR